MVTGALHEDVNYVDGNHKCKSINFMANTNGILHMPADPGVPALNKLVVSSMSDDVNS